MKLVVVTAEPAAVRPPFREPPHLLHPSGAVGIWFTDPPGLVSQFRAAERGSVELAAFIAHFGYAALLELHGRRKERFYLVHDLTLMVGYDGDARQLMTMWGLQVREHVERIVVVPPVSDEPSSLLGLQGSAAALIGRGLRFDFSGSVEEAIGRCGLVPQARGRRQPR